MRPIFPAWDNKLNILFKLAENMVEELMIVAKEVDGVLTGFGVVGPPGTGNSRFSMETGQDLRDCDVIGEGSW